jgi:hypothetical protein
MGLIVRKLKAGGVLLEDAPDKTQIPTRYVDEAVVQGWMKRINQRAHVRPAGPTMDDPLSTYNGTPHTFIHCDEIHIKTTQGVVKYKVTHQPDKYVEGESDDTLMTPEHYESGNTRVDHFYGVEKING